MSHLHGYRTALCTLPPSGGGGCHAALLGVANRGLQVGLSPEQIFRDLRATVRGSRPVPDHEIRQAICKAQAGVRAMTCRPWAPTSAAPTFDVEKLLRGILKKGAGASYADLWEASHVRINWEPRFDAQEILRRLYRLDDHLFIGARMGAQAGAANVRFVSDWLKSFEVGGPVPEHIIPNPLSGKLGLTREGKKSPRADSCVAEFRFAVVEFDSTPVPLRTPEQHHAAEVIKSRKYRDSYELGRLQRVIDWPREDQVAFWAGALAFGWPIAVLIDSGSRSVHAWLRVDARDTADWTAKVEGELFGRWLVPCGVDPQCRNESRLSRMPGHLRVERDRWQRILYINPAAGEVTT